MPARRPSLVFDKPGVASAPANIHDRTSAHIVVVDTPHFARTDARGEASLTCQRANIASRGTRRRSSRSSCKAQLLDIGASSKALVVTLPD